jgi:geranylgeranyl transferase type-2 subunit beta
MEDVVPMQTQLEDSSAGHLTTLPSFYKAKHIAFIKELAIELSKETSYEGAVTEHFRMSGVYWSLTALHIMMDAEQVDSLLGVTRKCDDGADESIIDWVWTCFDDASGSFGGNTGHQGHLLYTLSALQILAVSGQLESDRVLAAKPKIIAFVSSLQQLDGSFVGDLSALEIDTRFTYCAFQSLALLGALPVNQESLADAVVNVPHAIDYIMLCRNLDGGFGSCQGAESHAGQVFCCVGALAIVGGLDRLKMPAAVDVLPWWLAERQVDSGGLNGRPEKQADVCYSWWILSSLSILGKVNWINTDKLANYILKCQDDEDGGIADRPDDMADVFHTFFGVAGLSLLDYLPSTHRPIDPLYALPTDVVRSLNLPGQVMARDDGTVAGRLCEYSL